jgi:hypothetical protein
MSGRECSCHINPPCSYCLEKYECARCKEVIHPSESEPIYHEEGMPDATCSNCAEEPEPEL